MKKQWPLLLLVFFLPFSSLDARESGKIFDRVASVLESRFFDKKFRSREIPELARLFRPLAVKADSLEEERLVIHRFLSRIPVSHLAIYSEATFRNVRSAGQSWKPCAWSGNVWDRCRCPNRFRIFTPGCVRVSVTGGERGSGDG